MTFTITMDVGGVPRCVATDGASGYTGSGATARDALADLGALLDERIPRLRYGGDDAGDAQGELVQPRSQR